MTRRAKGKGDGEGEKRETERDRHSVAYLIPRYKPMLIMAREYFPRKNSNILRTG